MKPVAITNPRGRLPDLTPSRMAPLAHHQHLAHRALETANGDPKAALDVLTRAFAIHPRKSNMEQAALRRAHRLAIEAARAGTDPVVDDAAETEDDKHA